MFKLNDHVSDLKRANGTLIYIMPLSVCGMKTSVVITFKYCIIKIIMQNQCILKHDDV